MTAICECLNKPIFVIFSEKSVKSNDKYYSQITHDKILTKQTSWFVYDDQSLNEIVNIADRFLKKYTS